MISDTARHTGLSPAILSDLDANERLLARHLAAAVQRFGAAALSVIDLPPLTTGPIDAEQLRVAAVLLWAREIEEAGLPQFVDALADGLIKGRLTLPLTTGAERLMRYYRERESRLAAPERRAIYERLFGAAGPDGHPFASLFEQLLAVLIDIGGARERDNLSSQHARLGFLAQQLGELLSGSAGMAAFAARDVVSQIREAVDILHDPDVARVLGGGGLWMMIRTNGTAVAGREFDPAPHLARARAGQQILSWLGDAAGSLDASVALIDGTHPIVEAAHAWAVATAG